LLLWDVVNARKRKRGDEKKRREGELYTHPRKSLKQRIGCNVKGER